MFSLPDVIEPSVSACSKAQSQLMRALGSRVQIGAEISDDYQTDDSGIIGKRPIAVVLAETEQDLQTALRIAAETEVPIVPRAGGSGRTGGAVPAATGIVLATLGMNRPIELDRGEGSLVVAPGARLSEIHSLVESEGWFYPPDPNSAELCCIAGNVAENAAGPRAFKYGSTRDYVLGLDVFLMGGQKLFAGRRTRKGVTGYDIVSLLVGSEGTLGVFGNVTLKLIPKPASILTMLCSFSQMSDAARAVERVVLARFSPRCIEFLDEKTVSVMREHGTSVAEGTQALLLLEFDGSEAECERQAEEVGNLCVAAGAVDVRVALLAEQRKMLWNTRKQMSHAVRKRALHKISEDVVVPRRSLLELIDEVRRLGDIYQIDTLCYGHAGDGNLHVNFLWNTDEELPRVDGAVRDLFHKTIALGGTLSGEHGIGLLKAPFLGLEQSAPLVDLQRRIKDTFDPKGILNPGKIFPSPGRPNTHGSC
jgi:glycolate oxidase